MSYKHFTIEERDLILKYLTLKLSISEIAKKLKRNKSSISIEIRRNCINGEYNSFKAQENYTKSKQKCGRKNKLLLSENLKKAVIFALNNDWSPEYKLMEDLRWKEILEYPLKLYIELL